MGRGHGCGWTFIDPVNPVTIHFFVSKGTDGRVKEEGRVVNQLAKVPVINPSPFHFYSHFCLGPHTFLTDAGAISEHLPCIPTLAVFRRGRVMTGGGKVSPWPADFGGLAPCDLRNASVELERFQKDLCHPIQEEYKQPLSTC